MHSCISKQRTSSFTKGLQCTILVHFKHTLFFSHRHIRFDTICTPLSMLTFVCTDYILLQTYAVLMQCQGHFFRPKYWLKNLNLQISKFTNLKLWTFHPNMWIQLYVCANYSVPTLPAANYLLLLNCCWFLNSLAIFKNGN